MDFNEKEKAFLEKHGNEVSLKKTAISEMDKTMEKCRNKFSEEGISFTNEGGVLMARHITEKQMNEVIRYIKGQYDKGVVPFSYGFIYMEKKKGEEHAGS